MRPTTRFTLVIAIATLLAGCFGSSATPTPVAVSPTLAPTAPPPTATPAASVPGSDAPATATASPDLGPFSCDLPIHLDATVAIANIIDVRHGTYDDYDRAVFEFDGGLPEVFIERAAPPFTQDGSGLPLNVDGSSFLRITLRGGTKQLPSGESSYTGPTSFQPGYPTLVHLVEGGDFEAQATWYAGLTSEACLRVLVLVGEGGRTRLVLDIEH